MVYRLLKPTPLHYTTNWLILCISRPCFLGLFIQQYTRLVSIKCFQFVPSLEFEHLKRNLFNENGPQNGLTNCRYSWHRHDMTESHTDHLKLYWWLHEMRLNLFSQFFKTNIAVINWLPLLSAIALEKNPCQCLNKSSKCRETRYVSFHLISDIYIEGSYFVNVLLSTQLIWAILDLYNRTRWLVTGRR